MLVKCLRVLKLKSKDISKSKKQQKTLKQKEAYEIFLNQEQIYVFQCMGQLNDKFKQRVFNQLLWMKFNKDGNSGIINK